MDNQFFDQENREYFGINSSFTPEIGKGENREVSPEKRREIQRLFLGLLATGLGFGILASLFVVRLLNHFGLTEKTNQFERLHTPPQR